VKVRVDAERCEGFGNCAVHLPEVFVLDDWGYASVEGDGAVPEGKEQLATRAIHDCPAHAIHETDEAASSS
jgi:ferredoxin